LENDYENECLFSKSDESWLWHIRLAHIHTNHLNKLKSKDLVSGLPNIKFQDNRLCDACVKGKQIRTCFKSKDMVSTKKPLDVLYMDCSNLLELLVWLEISMHWLLLMIILDIHGLSFLLTKMMLVRLLRNWQKLCKMKMDVV